MNFSQDHYTPPVTFISKSPEDTIKVGESIGELCSIEDVICLTGDLGAGKTTFVKGLIQKLTGTPLTEIISPTFTYLNIYPGLVNIYHFDLYRLNSSNEFLQAGFHEFLKNKGICCIEWPDKLPDDLDIKKTFVHIEYTSSQERKITLRRPK